MNRKEAQQKLDAAKLDLNAAIDLYENEIRQVLAAGYSVESDTTGYGGFRLLSPRHTTAQYLVQRITRLRVSPYQRKHKRADV